MPPKGSIKFFSEDTKFTLPQKKNISNWLKDAIREEGYALGHLNFIFCSDEYLLDINQQYLNHNTFTDIITFDQREEPNEIAGDIFISIDRVKDNSQKFNSEFILELKRVIVHGVLHLAGYKDKHSGQKKEMRQKEDYYLSLHK